MSYNNLNQLTNRSGSGPLPVYFRGTVNEYSTVTVTNQLATLLDTNFDFEATVDLPPGTNEVPVVATAVNGDKTTNNYSLVIAGELGKTYAYDVNGNCTNVSMAGTNIWYQWDAENRLVAINKYVTNTATLQCSAFAYDGFNRWVQIIEKTNGVVVSTNNFVWCGSKLCQDRNGGNAVQKRFFEEGEQIAGTNYYFVRDQLGTVQDMVDTNGHMQAQYDYDPYGNQTEINGGMNADFGFAGMYVHQPSGLNLAMYRAYDPPSGRWLNRDPIQERGGLNLYRFVDNNPINWIDPLGLALYPPDFVGPLQPGDSRIPYPPSNIPGGPWTWSSNPQNSRGGDFIGPKQPTGPRTRCTYAPPGTVNNNQNPYWRKDSNGQRYNVNGEPITPEEAHPSPTPTTPSTTEPIEMKDPLMGDPFIDIP